MRQHHGDAAQLPSGPRWLLLLAMLATGCNTSRYGVTYEQRLPQLKRIAIVPASVEILAMHSGGVLEPLPDEAPQVAARTVAAISEVVRERGMEPIGAAAPTSRDAAGQSQAPQLALLAAVGEAILTHHYEFGRELFFQYGVGSAAANLAHGDADAVLCVYLRGVVPTGGRKALRIAAIAVGILTRAPFYVQTNDVLILLMLVDRSSGEVLWFNQYRAEASVTSERALKRAIDRACAQLLKARN